MEVLAHKISNCASIIPLEIIPLEKTQNVCLMQVLPCIVVHVVIGIYYYFLKFLFFADAGS